MVIKSQVKKSPSANRRAFKYHN